MEVMEDLKYYWHIRMKQKEEEGQREKDFAKELWQGKRVGLWLEGGLGRLRAARAENLNNQAIAQRLYPAGDQGAEKWVSTAIRFTDTVLNNHWVYTCFDGAVHVAQIDSDAMPGNGDRRILGPDQFIYREIKGWKTFKLGELPDCFRLLSAAGRETLCHPKSYFRLVKMLADKSNADANGVWEAFRKHDLEKQLDMYGPSSWEAFCVAYLVLENELLPTGLATGGTLEGLDIVGRDGKDRAIYAECKKNGEKKRLDLAKFLEALKGIPAEAQVFLFTYGDCTNILPARVNKLTRAGIVEWLRNTDNGKRYAKLLGLDRK